MEKRVIKFRAWNNIQKKMHSQVDIITPADGRSAVLPDGRIQTTANAARFSIMQFTGLFDRKAAEIWEGDILKYTHPDGDTIMSVIYNDCTACFDVEYPETFEVETLYTLAFEENKPEVIGNIYENPELLKN